MLSQSDPLPARPQRVVVAGVSGVGKSTLALRIADVLGLPYTEIDALFHGPEWVPRPTFLAEVTELAAAPTWVTEWQYTPAREVLAARADLMVWLDLGTGTTMRRVILRTAGRRARRTELWNGNVEGGLWTSFTSRDGVVRWAFATRHAYRRRVPDLAAQRPDLDVVWLRTQRDVDEWLEGPLAAAAAGGSPRK